MSNENEREHEQREFLSADVPVVHQSENASQQDDFAFREIENSWERSLEKFHDWYDTFAQYAYFKEKIIGKTGKKGKKNNFYWLETNDIYLETIQRAVKTDRDYWISVAEVSERIKDKDGKPIFREKWISQIRCHFLVLDLKEASRAENLGLEFASWDNQITELVLEHCRQRGLPEPIIWGDYEEVVILWPLRDPYYKPEINYFYNNRGEIIEDSFAFNYEWNDVQNLLYEDLKYLGANPKKKHAVTMLRVPGTFNTHADMPVRLLHDAEITTIEELNKGLQYVREALKNEQKIERPNLQAKLQEIEDEHERFLEFCDALDAIDAEVEENAPKSKSKKSKAKSTASKPKESKTAQKKKQSKSSVGVKPEKVSKPEESEILTVPPERQGEYEKFLEQIKQDVLQIHPANDSYIKIKISETSYQVFHKYVCLCLKKENEAWRQIFVNPCELEKKLTELWLRSDFSTHNIYVSQASFLRHDSRKIEDVASLSVSFLDIDGKFAKERNDLTPEEWADLIIEECRAKAIPLPNIIVFSGNGLHVKWLYKTAITREKLNRWTRLQKKLWKLFEDFGADSQAKDAARVLRIPGTKNCKPETVDRDVRVVKFNPERCEFEELEAKINELIPSDEDNLQDSSTTIAIPEVETPASENVPCFYVKNETTGVTEFVKTQEMSEYLSRQDKTHVLRRSIAEFWKPELKAVRRIYCNYAVLSSEKVPGTNLEEQAENIRRRCAEYWNGLGFQEPNGIMLFKDKIIVVWKYVLSDYLPRKALPRWKRTQEYICYHFADWGAMDEAEYQEVTGLLPIAEFTGNASEVLTSAARYKFDDLANQILRYSQKEVKDYKKKQAEEKAKAKEDLKTLAKTKRKAKSKKGHTEAFDGMAGRRFADILRLIELRKDKSGEVPQGHRELSVFWGMNFAAQAGLVIGLKDFDALTQKLIDENGLQFRSESNIRQFNSLRERFIRQDRELYKAFTETLIDQLGIKESEQKELEVLREFPKKEKKTGEPKAPSLESLKLWELEGISRRTWYRRRKAERETLKEEEAKRQYSLKEHEKIITRVIEKIVRIAYTKANIDTARAHIMRGRERERNFEERKRREACVLEDFSKWRNEFLGYEVLSREGREAENGEKTLMRIAVGMFSNVLEGAERGNANTRISFLLLVGGKAREPPLLKETLIFRLAAEFLGYEVLSREGREAENGEKTLMRIAVGMFSNVLEGAERGNANMRISFF